MRRWALTALALPLCTGPAWAGGVTVVNTGGETIRRIEVGTPDNRLRGAVPPGAQASITYSTGCTADVRLGYDSGRTETIAGVDVCSNPRVAPGQGVVGTGPAPVASTPAAAAGGSTPVKAGGPPPPGQVAKAPPPVVPPWTGKSITKRFGGLD